MKVYVFDPEMRYIMREFVGINKEGVLIEKGNGGILTKAVDDKLYEFDFSKTVMLPKPIGRAAFYKFDGINYIQISFKESETHGTLATYISQWNYSKLMEDKAMHPPKDEQMMKTMILMGIIQIVVVVLFSSVLVYAVQTFQKSTLSVPAVQMLNKTNQLYGYLISHDNVTNNELFYTVNALRDNTAATRNLTSYIQLHGG